MTDTEEREEWPRIHTLTAVCCGQRILTFELPSRADAKLQRTATIEGWTRSADGWHCADHPDTDA